MENKARLIIGEKEIHLPIIEGTEGDKAIDIRALRSQTGYITYDPGLANTGVCKSSITYMDGENGILRYRGIPIEELAENSTFVETSYLLINGRLPTQRELNAFSVMLNDHSLVHEDMRHFFENFPRRAHPMGILSSMVNALRFFYPELPDEEDEISITFARLLSKVRTMAAMSYKISRGHKVVYPRHDLSYPANFLNMMFDSPVKPYIIDQDNVKALNVFWILHADHEQNCSTAAVRLVGSARVNLYAAISAGICALWGPLHGGANQRVVEQLQEIYRQNLSPKGLVEKVKREKNFRLMGFGHRVYKTFDPRAKIMKEMAHKLVSKLPERDPLLDIAMELEEIAINDPYFQERKLYPNVDFYSGIVLRALGIPLNMFTVMFAIGRLPGWISQWKEDRDDPESRLYRPRQIYVGENLRHYVPIRERDS
ncbi:MAG: citrate synthase [Desulfatiglandales bacterium]